MAGRVAQLRGDQDTFERFEAAQGWRRDDLVQLRAQLDHHWADVVTSCVRADDPLAFGIDKVRHARTTTVADLGRLDAAIPVDRNTEWDQTRRHLPESSGPATTPNVPWPSARPRSKKPPGAAGAATTTQAIATAQRHLSGAEQRMEAAIEAEQNLRERLDVMRAIKSSVAGDRSPSARQHEN